jgi:hypothetical protein
LFVAKIVDLCPMDVGDCRVGGVDDSSCFQSASNSRKINHPTHLDATYYPGCENDVRDEMIVLKN